MKKQNKNLKRIYCLSLKHLPKKIILLWFYHKNKKNTNKIFIFFEIKKIKKKLTINKKNYKILLRIKKKEVEIGAEDNWSIKRYFIFNYFYFYCIYKKFFDVVV